MIEYLDIFESWMRISNVTHRSKSVHKTIYKQQGMKES